MYFAIAALVMAAGAAEVDHGPFDALLRQFVRDSHVDYRGLAAHRDRLAAYTESLAAVDVSGLSNREQMAVYINAYNACTLLLILEHVAPGFKSIMDIPEAKRWKHKRWTVGGERYSLDEMEHQVLRRRFPDARIHAALNCASVGCPDLRAEAFIGPKLDTQLDEQFRRFINNPRHVLVRNATLHLSPIFDWFKEDFTRNGESVSSWIIRYAAPDLAEKLARIGPTPKIVYLDYDWALNAVEQQPDPK